MIALNFPPYTFQIKRKGNLKFIWDEIRNKYVRLTSEEWVRQHVIKFLLNEKNYPKSLITVEQSISKYIKNRADIVVYKPDISPFLIVECKRPKSKIKQNVIQQILSYGSFIDAKYFYITNGLKHYIFTKSENNKYFSCPLPNHPSYNVNE